MSIWIDLRELLRQAILIQDRVEQLTTGIEKASDRLAEHDRRLVRIETMIALAQRRALRGD
jgi:hypothetical protein